MFFIVSFQSILINFFEMGSVARDWPCCSSVAVDGLLPALNKLWNHKFMTAFLVCTMLGSKSGIHTWLVALYSYIPSATIFKYLGFFTLVLNIRLFFHIHISEIKERYNTNL